MSTPKIIDKLSDLPENVQLEIASGTRLTDTKFFKDTFAKQVEAIAKAVKANLEAEQKKELNL